MSTTIKLSEETQQNLSTVRRELHESSDVEDAINLLAAEFARRSDHLRVDPSGSIAHSESESDVIVTSEEPEDTE